MGAETYDVTIRAYDPVAAEETSFTITESSSDNSKTLAANLGAKSALTSKFDVVVYDHVVYFKNKGGEDDYELLGIDPEGPLLDAPFPEALEKGVLVLRRNPSISILQHL